MTTTSYVIVAFHRPDALALLLAVAARDDVEIVVVNVEADADVARVAGEAGARVVALATNVGFAVGVNAGVAAAHGDVVVFSNDDLVATADDVAALAEVVRGERVGVAVPKIVDASGVHELSIAALPTVGALAREWLALPDRPVPWLVRRLRVEKWRSPERAERVDAATAAIVATRRDLLVTEPMPEAYFLYWEESEWFWRLHERGVVVEYHPEVVVQHMGGRADIRPDKARLLARNAVRCVRRTQGRSKAAAALAVVVAWNVRLVATAIVRRRGLNARLAGLGAAVASVREVLG